MIATSVNPCIVIILHIPHFQHVLWPGALTYISATVTLTYFYIDPSIKVCFSAAIIAVSVKPCIVIFNNISSTHYNLLPLTNISRSTDFIIILRRP